MMKKPDRLSALIKQFRIKARVYPVGVGDDVNRQDSHPAPNLFIIHEGGPGSSHTLFGDQVGDQVGKAPALVFFPHGAPPAFELKDDSDNVEYVCASVDTGGDANPIAIALPDVVTVKFDEAMPLQAVTDILLEEALAPRCGAQAVIDRLCEIVVIRLLRHLIETGKAEVGLVAGLAHPNLSLAIVAIHDNPEKNWRLEDLAEISAMSRTHFVNIFRDVVGVTPGEYLSSWRLTLVRMEIARGASLKSIVQKVGFSSSAALSRAYKRRYGISPRQELARLA